MREDQKNLILAMGLSLLVIIGWQYFYAKPRLDQAHETIAQTQDKTAATAPPPNAVTNASPAATPQDPGLAPTANASAAQVEVSREDALKASPRVPIDTRSLTGSIDLKGGRIDDVSLKGYRETVDPASPIIVLLSPAGSPHPYFVETGFVGEPNANVAVPRADTLWKADDAGPLTASRPVSLTFDNGQGLVFHRTIAVDDQYMFTVKDRVENKGAGAIKLYPYSLVSRHGRPITSNYAVLHEGYIGVVGDSRVQEITYDAILKETQTTRILDGTGGWLGFTDKYWAATVIPDQSKPFKGRFSATGDTVKTYQTDALGDAQSLAPGAVAETTTRIFAGAKETRVVDGYQASLGIRNFDLVIDWGWFYFITKPLFWVIDSIYHFVGNFGVAILITTVLVKTLFFPLASRSYLSMAKMKALQPQMAALKERYPDDKQKQQQETMALYKREGVNPVAGCLPMVLQVPVFFALYKVIFITIEMRQAPFFGWIKDLSAPDPTNVFTLFGLIPWNPTAAPMIGHFLALGVWPLLMGVSMFFQMKMNPEPQDPVQKQMFTYMPVIFTFMLGTFPAGLVIYWTWNNSLSVLQQALIMRKNNVQIELWGNLSRMFGSKSAKPKALSSDVAGPARLTKASRKSDGGAG